MAKSSLVLVKIRISVSLIILCFPTHPLFQCTFTQMHVSRIRKFTEKQTLALVLRSYTDVYTDIHFSYVRRHKYMQ